MNAGLVIVLDVGKTLAKLSLWTPEGALVERRTRINERIETRGYIALDAIGIETWLVETLREFASLGEVSAIIPVAHGAAAAVIRRGVLACPPIDYEDPLRASERAEYEQMRDPFSMTGSPLLPDGLNLGAQLDRLDRLHPGLLTEGSTIITWPQYWSWVLSGVASTEVTSLGCHSDLWQPNGGAPSGLANRRGWSKLLAPLRRAGDVLGPITADWAGRTGLGRDVVVFCGLHDSNAALLAARAFPEIADTESTVLSTGTWFVAMRTPAPNAPAKVAALPVSRDCLMNVDAFGQPVPSSRFMGGRELELLTGLDTRRVDIRPDQPALVAAMPRVIEAGAMVLPTMAPGFGPFPNGRGRWVAMPTDWSERRAAVCLYVALVADEALNLIGSQNRILVEGRFAEAEVFVRALASIRPNDEVYVSNAHNDVSFGALRLVNPAIVPTSALARVQPLPLSLEHYRARWRRETARLDRAA